MVLEIGLSIAGFVLISLFSIIGFLLKRILADFTGLKKSLESLTIGMNSIQGDLNNNTKDVAEIKTALHSLDKDITRRLDKQADAIQWNRDKIIELKSNQENCTARKQAI